MSKVDDLELLKRYHTKQLESVDSQLRKLKEADRFKVGQVWAEIFNCARSRFWVIQDIREEDSSGDIDLFPIKLIGVDEDNRNVILDSARYTDFKDAVLIREDTTLIRCIDEHFLGYECGWNEGEY